MRPASRAAIGDISIVNLEEGHFPAIVLKFAVGEKEEENPYENNRAHYLCAWRIHSRNRECQGFHSR